MPCDRSVKTPYDAVEGRLLGGFADTRRTNAGAGDLHSEEVQLQVRRIRDLHTRPTLHPRHSIVSAAYGTRGGRSSFSTS
jgi:hypothetical protein